MNNTDCVVGIHFNGMEFFVMFIWLACLITALKRTMILVIWFVHNKSLIYFKIFSRSFLAEFVLKRFKQTISLMRAKKDKSIMLSL